MQLFTDLTDREIKPLLFVLPYTTSAACFLRCICMLSRLLTTALWAPTSASPKLATNPKGRLISALKFPRAERLLFEASKLLNSSLSFAAT